MPFGNHDFENRIEVVIQFDEQFISQKISVFPEFNALLKVINLSKRGLIFHPSVKTNTAHLFEKFDKLNPAEKLLNVFKILHALSQTSAFDTIKENDFNIDYRLKDFERINYAFEYVNQTYHKNISTSHIAHEIGLTTNSFCRLFKKTTHKTFTQFVNEFRVQKAVDLLDLRKFSVSEVMFQCGYNDPSYFAKQFKRNKGLSPTQYLKNNAQH